MLLNHRENRILTWQRRKIRDQRIALHNFRKIDIYRVGQFVRSRFDFQHLPRANVLKLTRMFNQRRARFSFQNNQLAVPQLRRFENERCAGDADRHRFRLELAATRIFRHINENRAAAQISAATRLVETKDRVRAHSRDR